MISRGGSIIRKPAKGAVILANVRGTVSARQLLEEFTAASFRDTKKAAEMFADNRRFEMPYLESLGIPWRYEGREEIQGFFKFVRDPYPNMDFHDVKIVCETPNTDPAQSDRGDMLK